MAFEQKDNTGSLFKNDRKEKETHPDYKGTVRIGGVEYWQSAWVKDVNGRKYFSQSFTPKEQQSVNAQANNNSQTNFDPQPNDLPF